MANNFCRFLSNGYRIHSYGTSLKYRPCCWFREEIDILEDPNWLEKKNQISQVQDWIPECGCRGIEENDPSNSPRLRSFLEIPDGTTPDNTAVWLELTLDLNCNAACIMCYRGNSSTWWKQELKFGWITPDDVPNFVDPVVLLDQLKEKIPLDQVKKVDFLGGEPFLSPVPRLVLEHLKQVKGTLNQVRVMFQTNGSIMPDNNLLDLMTQCKLVIINASIDAVGKQFDYIRYPLSWDRVEANLKAIKNLNMSNLRFQFLATINPLNAYYYDDLEKWCQDNFGFNVHIHLNRSAGHVDLMHMSPELKNVLVEKYGEHHSIAKLIKNINCCGNCVDWIESLEEHRGNSWKTTFPEIVTYLSI